MNRGILSDFSPIVKLTFLIILTIVIGTIVTLAGGSLGTYIFDTSFRNLFAVDPLSVKTNINILKYLQAFQSIGMFMLPPIVFSFFCYTDDVQTPNQYSKTPQGPTLLFVAFAMLSALPIINLLSAINANMHLPQALKGIENWMKEEEMKLGLLTMAFMKSDSIGVLLINLFVMAVLPAIGEEFMFRGCLQRIFTDMAKNKHLGILITAILFSAIHLQFYGFLPRMALGILLGYMFLWSGSIWTSVWAHFINNGIGVLAVYLQGKHAIGTGIDNVGATKDTTNLLISSLLIFIMAVILIYNEEKKIPALRNFRNFGMGDKN